MRGQYGTTEALRAAGQVGSEPLGDEMLTNGDFAGGTDRWTFEQGTTARMDAEVVDEPETGGKALDVTTLSQGQEAWNLQVHQVGLTLEDGQVYTLAFRARSDEPRTR